ncbi:mercuric reductase [Pedobacter sandarakinus]|uniref:mercuric reductase n=1 Tax=Pedobacter sandarakinus TaxID=353156 RepID=UPI002246C08B|nr:mercuric reductase [Pedobacter sandarakinus]MCX2574905.1 mercuric reductase [Pedobacter sandarakinus]
MKHYDAIIIGAGQAGVPLAKKMAEAGKKTALIEKRMVGGTCINDGCTPTKAMVASARAVYQAKKSAELGVITGDVRVDFKQVKKRKDDIVASFKGGAEKGIEETKNLKLYMGEAVFTAEKEIVVKSKSGKETHLSADLIFINTGAQTRIPDIEGLQDVDYLTSTSILDLDEVPEHLIVLGGNYIGLEFGQMFKRFGSRVTILEKAAHIISKEDKDISENLTDILIEEGIEIVTNVNVEKVGWNGDQIEVILNNGKKQRKIKGSHLLIAVGRTPQTKSLGLEFCGVATDDHGHITVNSQLETNVKGIYALGDVKGGPAFTHIAYNDYTIVYRNLVEQKNFTTENRPVPYCMFTDPQLGRIGISEEEAKKQQLNYEVAVLPMKNVARGIETGETRGMMKAVVDKQTKEILGAAILAPEGGEIMSVLQLAMEGGITYDKIRYGVFAHPTYAESLNNLFMKILP